MPRGPIKSRVSLVCQECKQGFPAKRCDTKYCTPCRKITKLRLDNASRDRRHEEVNARARARTACLTEAQKHRRLINQRKRRWEKTYGLSVEAYYTMQQTQQGLCALCKTAPAEAIDHCHTTGQVRKLLCTNCNLGLGSFFDNPTVLRRAADYVEQYKSE